MKIINLSAVILVVGGIGFFAGYAVAKDFKIPDNSTIPDAINQIGNEGWELVSVLPDMRSSRDSPMTTYYFKK